MPDLSSLNLKLKPKSGTVPRMWHNTGKRGGEYKTNVVGVRWHKQASKWKVEHISAETNEPEFLGLFDTWEEACVKRASVTDGTPKKGQVCLLNGQVCVDICNHSHCPRKNQPVEEYQPNTTEKNRLKFMEAVQQYQEEQNENNRLKVEKKRTKHCITCRSNAKKTQQNPDTATGEIRQLHFQSHEQQTCVVCGTNRCIEADNVLSEEERAKLFKEGKVATKKHIRLSDYREWARPENGGVEGWKMERDNVVEFKCRMCHRLEKTGSAGRKVTADTPEEEMDYWQKKKLPRYQAVDAMKRAIGRCENKNCPMDGKCKGRCIEGHEVCFDWDHVIEHLKGMGISEMCYRLSFKLSLEKFMDKVKQELDKCKCRLLCANCHQLKTHHGYEPVYDPYEYKRSSPLKLNMVEFDIDRPEDFAQIGTWALKLSQTGPWHVHLSVANDNEKI